MENRKKRLLDNFLSLSFLQIASYVMPLISLPYLSRVLGAELFGLVFFAIAFAQYFNIITDFGFGLSATKEIAVNRHNKNSLSDIFSSVMFIKSVLLIVSFIAMCVIIFTFPKLRENWLIFILTFIMIAGNAIYPIWFFQGMEKMRYITALNVTAKFIFIFLIFVFVNNKTDYILVPLLYSLGFLISGILGMYFALKNFNIKLYIPKFKSIKKQFKYSLDFFLSRISLSIYSNTNTFCLGFISNIMVSYYVAAEKIYLAQESLVTPLNNTLYPYIASTKDYNTYKKILKNVCILNTFVCIIVFIFAKDIITIFYGTELTNAYPILRILCCVVFLSVPNILIGFPLLGASGYTNIANRSIIIGSVVHLLGLFTLYMLKIFNAYSVAMMVFFTESIVFGIRTGAVLKYKLLKTD